MIPILVPELFFLLSREHEVLLDDYKCAFSYLHVSVTAAAQPANECHSDGLVAAALACMRSRPFHSGEPDGSTDIAAGLRFARQLPFVVEDLDMHQFSRVEIPSGGMLSSIVITGS